jgi:hypothetical protein
MPAIITALKQTLCSHEFAIEDLQYLNEYSDGNDRVSWPCAKCGKVFTAHCGVQISPEHGPMFRRKSLNARP